MLPCHPLSHITGSKALSVLFCLTLSRNSSDSSSSNTANAIFLNTTSSQISAIFSMFIYKLTMPSRKLETSPWSFLFLLLFSLSVFQQAVKSGIIKEMVWYSLQCNADNAKPSYSLFLSLSPLFSLSLFTFLHFISLLCRTLSLSLKKDDANNIFLSE